MSNKMSKAPRDPKEYQDFLDGLKKQQAGESQQKKTTGQSQRTPGNGVLFFLVLVGFCLMSMAAIFLLQLIK